MQRYKSILHSGNRIVVKIGTNLLADKEKGINPERMNEIAKSVSSLHRLGKQVVLVSSGAIGAGVAALKLRVRPKTIPEKQATAAIGQPLLMEAYENAFRAQKCTVAQILLTKDDFTNRARYVNAKNTFLTLLEKGVVPIINENDTVAVEEIKLGDNDNLSALVANLVEADLLIILSDIDGLFSDDPAKNQHAELIPIVEKITPEIETLAKSSKTELSTGGMITKIQAAKRCVSAGIAMIITNGKNPKALPEILTGDFKGTLFLPAQKRLNVRKKWIGFVSHSNGHIVVDDGAKSALLKRQKSLLPSGILEVHGEFKAHDTISVRDTKGMEIAKGVTGFSSADIVKIKGKKTGDIEKILNSKSCGEVIHRDNLVLIGEE
ncbi:MAG: glutamate 5-kinase [Bacteroidetes bacterium]|nr:glutamate 5-kinase [Bacteroidota bacterium]